MNLNINLTDKQLEFLDASYTYPVVFFGGARGGGKSHGLRTLLLIRSLETSGLRIGLFRRTYPEIRSNHVEPLLAEHPWIKDYYNKSDHIIRLPNDSIIELCYCDNEDDVFRYQGREYHILAIDEAGQWTESMFWTLRGSNRSSRPDIKPVTLLTGNPGGIGHGWLKRLFVDRDFNERERPSDFFFIKSMVYDCIPLIENDPDYVSRLEAEPNESLRRAYLDGDWSIFAGQFFSEWSPDVHVLPIQWQPEDHWQRFGAFDPGFFHPAAFGWFACDEQGRVYLYRELVERNLRIDEIVNQILSYPDSFNLQFIVGGLDCWSRGRDGGPTIAEQFNNMTAGENVTLTKANTDRVQGASQVRAYLAHKGTEPRFFIHASCKRTIECIPRLMYNPKKPEDVLKIDASDLDPFSGDDTYDMVRYFLMSRPQASSAPVSDKPLTMDERVRNWQNKRRKRLAKKNKMGSVDSVLGSRW